VWMQLTFIKYKKNIGMSLVRLGLNQGDHHYIT
jgi:hypothetical protein